MKTRTEWDFELWREPNMLADLNYAIRGHVIQEARKVEDENRRKHLDLHLLARLRLERLARARWTKLHGCRCEIRASASSIACTESCFWTVSMSATRTCGRMGSTDLDVELE
jgi:hypothetical protein